MGAKRRLNGTSKVNRRTNKQTDTRMDISTYRKHRPRGPMLWKWGRCFEGREFRACLKWELACVLWSMNSINLDLTTLDSTYSNWWHSPSTNLEYYDPWIHQPPIKKSLFEQHSTSTILGFNNSWVQRSWTAQPSATCILNIALPTRDGCDKF